MRDAVFSGRDVAEAVAQAARSLGLAPEALRYVVLDAGSPPGLGTSGTLARIAVLQGAQGAQQGGGAPQAAQPAAQERPLPPPSSGAPDPLRGLEQVVQAVLREADLGLSASLEDGPDAVAIRLQGPDEAVFLREQGELLEALEHLLQRMFGEALRPRRVLVDCGGRRARREDALRDLARQLIEAVRADGRPHTTPEPLNAYERRLLHMTVAQEPGLRSFSLGTAREKRVTVARADQPGLDAGE
jgi:spoIIIJ-associated protein